MAQKRNIKGPTSALTDFLQEHGIVARDLPKSGKKGTEVDVIYSEKPVSKKRKTISGKQIELTNRNNYFLSEAYERAKKMYDAIENIDFTNDDLKILIFYLSKIRDLDQKNFDIILKFAKDELEIFDCSKIENYVKLKNFEILKFNLCGKLKNDQLEKIFLNNQIKYLKLNGGYLLHDFKLPISVQELDISYCTRLTENFFIKLKNNQLTKIDFSYNLNITKNFTLPIHIDEIYAEETFISEKFLHNCVLEKIKSLNINRCINFSSQFEFDRFKNIEILEVEGLSKINLNNISIKIKKLNIARAFDCENILYLENLKNLEYLNISFLNLTDENLKFIFSLKKLKFLNLSYLKISENFIKKIVKVCPEIKKIYVFGCFNLTEDLAEYAWDNFKKVEIIGNPLETRFLLN